MQVFCFFRKIIQRLTRASVAAAAASFCASRKFDLAFSSAFPYLHVRPLVSYVISCVDFLFHFSLYEQSFPLTLPLSVRSRTRLVSGFSFTFDGLSAGCPACSCSSTSVWSLVSCRCLRSSWRSAWSDYMFSNHLTDSMIKINLQTFVVCCPYTQSVLLYVVVTVANDTTLYFLVWIYIDRLLLIYVG